MLVEFVFIIKKHLSIITSVYLLSFKSILYHYLIHNPQSTLYNLHSIIADIMLIKCIVIMKKHLSIALFLPRCLNTTEAHLRR